MIILNGGCISLILSMKFFGIWMGPGFGLIDWVAIIINFHIVAVCVLEGVVEHNA